MKLSAVILDFDGVLIDTETISRNAWMQAASEFGFEFPESLYEEIVGNSVLAARKRITEFVDGLIDMDQYMDRSAAIYNGTMATNGIDVMPGVIELIEFIREHNLKNSDCHLDHLRSGRVEVESFWIDWNHRRCHNR